MLVKVMAEITNPMGLSHREVWLVEMHEDEGPVTERVRYKWSKNSEFPVGTERVR